MEATGRPSSGGSDTGNGDTAPVIPVWQQRITLLLRAECLMGAAVQALKGGDETTATRLIAEAREAASEERALAERASNQ